MEASTLKLIFSSIISFLVTFYLVPVMCSIARKWNVMDMPDGNIKQHKKPTPYLGGIAVYLGFIVALALIVPFHSQLVLILAGITLLLFLGLLDDLVALKAQQKFFGQALVALIFLKAGFYLKTTFFLNNIWNIPASLLWILLIMNAFNLVDVMDGLATTIACFSTITFLIIALITGQQLIAYMLMPFLGALLGFLWYNKPPASIYLGDTGSLFIGGFLAVVPFLFNWSEYTPLGFFAPFIVLALPLLEVGTLIVVRTYKRIPFYNGSPDHFSIYLRNKGWSVRYILGYVATLSVILGVTSVLFMLNKLDMTVVGAGSCLFLLVWYSNLLRN